MGDHGAGQLSPLFERRMFRWDRQSGGYRVDLDTGLRRALRAMMEQFLTLLDDPGSPVLHRLFPPAYSEAADLARQEEYRRLMLEDLVERHRDEARAVLDTVDAVTLSEEQLLAWCRSVNGLRLALGTYLDVSDDDEARAPESPEETMYHLLSYVLEEAVDAMSRRI
ncbi:MAG TPA: DUF2017 family protein [Acidimicrobiales bacterium]|nr:DUF2017 family protein [Acidimicrobiales bacterium]